MELLYLIAKQNIDKSVVQYAAEVVKKMDAVLTFLVIAKDEEKEKEALAALEKINAALEDIDFKVLTETGDPVDALLAALAQKPYEMVMMGVPRRRRVIPSQYRILSQRIINNCPIPIMLIRRVSKKLERMLVCTGGKEISQPVVELSARLATTADLEATLLNVAGAVPSMYTGIDVMDESLENLLETETPLAQHLRTSAETLSRHNISAEIKIKHGDVVEEILEEINNRDYDLVVMGEPSEQMMTRLLLGNVTQQIINRAASAVLIVK